MRVRPIVRNVINGERDMGDIGVYILAGVIAAALLVLVIVRFTMWLQSFLMELRYLDKEIERTAGEEKQHWIKRKKRLLLSWIPFVRY